jgi:ABC-type polysaccharide/polyol phosphate export permease
MTRSAVLIGRTGSDIVYNVLSITIMALTGLLVGWRIRTSVWEALAGFGLLILFSYAFSWVMASVGLVVPSPEVVNNASFMVIMPLTFISNAFVPSDSLPGPLRVFAEWNPVSAVTQGARNLFGNVNPLAPPPEAWPMQNPVLYTMIWIAVIMLVFVPFSIRLYKRAASK